MDLSTPELRAKYLFIRGELTEKEIESFTTVFFFLKTGLAYPLIPFVWAMGVPWQDCFQIGHLLAKKFIVSEFVSYKIMMKNFKKGLLTVNYRVFYKYISEGKMYRQIPFQARSVVINTYALCGFSSIGSMGNVIGVYSYLIPSRADEFMRVYFRALLAGNLACCLTACVAGTS